MLEVLQHDAIAIKNGLVGRTEIGSGPPGGATLRRRRVELLEDRRVLSTLNLSPAPIADGTTGNTLCAAIARTNSDTTDSVVNIQLSAGTYALTLGQLEISNTTATVNIIGTGSSGASASIIDAGGTSRVFQVDTGATVVLEDLEITGGKACVTPGGTPLAAGSIPAAISSSTT